MSSSFATKKTILDQIISDYEPKEGGFLYGVFVLFVSCNNQKLLLATPNTTYQGTGLDKNVNDILQYRDLYGENGFSVKNYEESAIRNDEQPESFNSLFIGGKTDENDYTKEGAIDSFWQHRVGFNKIEKKYNRDGSHFFVLDAENAPLRFQESVFPSNYLKTFIFVNCSTKENFSRGREFGLVLATKDFEEKLEITNKRYEALFDSNPNQPSLPFRSFKWVDKQSVLDYCNNGFREHEKFGLSAAFPEHHRLMLKYVLGKSNHFGITRSINLVSVEF